MKRIITILLITSLLFLACVLCLASCSSVYYGPYIYSVENREVTIEGYFGLDPDIVIPESVYGMPVVAIGDTASFGLVRSVTIPDSVVKIGGLAFDGSPNLERVTLGNGIREIDFSAFDDCPKLEYNEYGNGYYLGNKENPYIALVSATSKSIEEISIHPDTVVICGSAMQDCDYLTEIVIPEGVLSLSSFSLYHCSYLERIYLPSTLEYIDSLALNDCNSLLEFVVAEENPHFKSIDGNLFSGDGKHLIKYTVGKDTESYRIPDGTEYIYSYAFQNAENLTEVAFPDSLTDMGGKVFIDCENLQRISFGSSLKIIGDEAFTSTAITEITIPDSVEEIEYNAFSYCTSLERVVIGGGVNYIDSGVFSGCDALSEIVFCDPVGWKITRPYQILADEIDVSNSALNAQRFTNEYRERYWLKDE